MKKENAHCIPKNTAGATDKPHSATTMHRVKELALPSTDATNQPNNFGLQIAGACTAAPRCGTIRPKAKAPACRNVKGKAVASPTDKRGFVMPKISRNGFARTGMVCVHGVAYPQGWPHGFTHVTKRHAHSLPVVRQRVVLKSRKGAKTMHPVNPLGHSAPTTPTLGKPSTSTTSTEAQAFALLEATSNANLAAFYIRKGNVQAARRKAVQLLKAIQALEVAHG